MTSGLFLRNVKNDPRRHFCGRRTFLRLGGSAALLSTVFRGHAAHAASTDALLLSCMDYRLVYETERYMAGRNMRDKYDHVILAGAALGAITTKYPAWNKTFWDHLNVAIQLHAIHQVIVLDHRDCGAYKVILGEDLAPDPARETTVHATKLRELRKQINAKHPKLAVELLLMDLDGQVQSVA